MAYGVSFTSILNRFIHFLLNNLQLESTLIIVLCLRHPNSYLLEIGANTYKSGSYKIIKLSLSLLLPAGLGSASTFDATRR